MLRYFLSIVCGIFISLSVFAEEKLIFAIDIVRHGDRTPLMASPEMKKNWPQGVGQLTPIGMHQEYELGKILRQRYVNKYHLLPKNYDINTMTVRSSGIPRTMMSAQSLLFGLYPLGTGPSLDESTKALPQGLQPIPINTVPHEQDSLLIPNHDKVEFRQLLETYILNSPEWIQKDNELKSNYLAWSKIFGVEVDNLFDLIQVSDRLFIEQLYNIPFPSALQKKDVDKILSSGKWALLHIANNSELSLRVGSELAQTIKNAMISATEQNRSLKYLLFVAHDTTLQAQLKILGQTIDDIPPYASEINYALFDTGSSNYEVRVTYNQRPLFIKECWAEHCGLNDFINLIDSKLINNS